MDAGLLFFFALVLVAIWAAIIYVSKRDIASPPLTTLHTFHPRHPHQNQEDTAVSTSAVTPAKMCSNAALWTMGARQKQPVLGTKGYAGPQIISGV